MASITLYDSHRPALGDGDYEIKAEQVLNAGASSFSAAPFVVKFKVQGEQYSLDEQQIDSVFPPANAMGDFSLVLPHVILNRSTLPWERCAAKDITTHPWLGLLLFSEDEQANEPAIDKFSQANVTKTALGLTVPDREKNDLVSVIKIGNSLIEKVLPQFDDLRLLSHVRSVNADKTEKAVIVCNRLPKMDCKNILHLVSFENCFSGNDNSYSNTQFPGVAGDVTTLISLKSWSFFCNDHFTITKEVLDKYAAANPPGDSPINAALYEIVNKEYFDEESLLNDLKSKLDKSFVFPAGQPDGIYNAFRTGHLPHILKHLNRQPSSVRLNYDEAFATDGYIRLPYTLDTGKQINVLYRGPLLNRAADIMKSPVEANIIPLESGDKAMRYLDPFGLVDCSYAAAWELGRMLALQSKNFSVALFQWKRSCYHAYKLWDNKQHGHLPGATPKNIYPSAPSLVINWFNDIKQLKGIPYNYVVPSPEMLPFEAIRFFMIDNNWLSHLIDGALSIGRISAGDRACDKELYDDFDFLKTSVNPCVGFLLHSVAVAGWPGMVIKGSTTVTETKDELMGLPDDATTLPARRERLSQNVLICLFNYSIKSVSFYQKPDTIHFGFGEGDNETVLCGITDSTGASSSITVPVTDDHRRIKASELFDELKKAKVLPQNDVLNEGAPGAFANMLVEKTEAVTFNFTEVRDM